MIFVVEDDKTNRELLEMQLQHFGYTVAAAADGREALEWLEHNTPDLIVLDWMLPSIDGLTLCKQIRKKHTATQVPILMLSALGKSADDRVRGLEAGANDFLAKPWHAKELDARIKGLLQTRQEHKRLKDLLFDYLSRAGQPETALEPHMMERLDYAEAIVMFSDLRGFTAFSDNAPPSVVMDVLDEFFYYMMLIVNHYKGKVMNLLGDELLTVFNIPTPVDDAKRMALKAALEMQQTFRHLQRRWQGNRVYLGLGIGLHQGDVTLGNVGSSSFMQYTVTGTTVNLAHRLCNLAQDGDTVVSPQVFDSTTVSEQLTVSDSTQAIKGFAQPIKFYRLRLRDQKGLGTDKLGI